MRGEEIRFAFNDDKGVTRTLTGTVRGNELTGTLKGAERRRNQSHWNPQVISSARCFDRRSPAHAGLLLSRFIPKDTE